MKSHIENSALINQYINKSLSQDQTIAFEERLKLDPEFQDLYHEQMALVEGVKRAGLKNDIQAAKQSYLQFKWLKILGISLSAIVVLLVVWTTFFKPAEAEIKEPIIESKTVVTTEKEEQPQVQENVKQVVADSMVIQTITPAQTKIELVDTATPVEVGEAKDETEIVVSEEAIQITETDSPSETIDYVFGSLFETVKKEPQIIEVNTEQAFSITLKEGTILNIPEHAFVDAKSGKLIRGTIQLEVTEYYKLSDMLLGDLSTTSNGEQLETGGMLYIAAKKDENDLKLKKNISLAFPYEEKKEGMQLFSGEQSRDIINWVPENNEVLEETINTITFDENIEGHVEVPFDLVENVPVFPGCGGGTNDELKACFNTKMNAFFKENFNIEVAKELELTGMNRVNVFFKIDRGGAIFDVALRASSVTLGNEILRVINTLPQCRPALQRGKPVTVPYFMPFEFDLPGATKKLPSVTLKSNEISKNNLVINNDSTLVFNSKQFKPKDFNAYEVSSYALSSAKLGWINCDLFTRYRGQKVKYKFKLKNSEGTNVKMIFKSMSSILPSRLRSQDIDFGMVPKDEEVVLVAVKKVDNTFYLGIKETQTREVSEMEFDFKAVTVNELKQEMIKLNALFN